MVHSKTEPKSVTFRRNADMRNLRERNGQEESESDLTSDSASVDPSSKDTLCVRKEVYRMIQKMAETPLTESADDTSSVSGGTEMSVSKATNKVTEPKSEESVRISEGNESKCTCGETKQVAIAPERSCLCTKKHQTEDSTQTEGVAANPWTCLCHYSTVVPLTIPGHMATICNENRYHRMHISQVTAPQECACVSSKESFTSIFEPIRKKAKKNKKSFPYCQRSSTTSIHQTPLPGPDGIPVATPAKHVQDAGTETMAVKEERPERVDVYYFDHGNSGYYRTTDRPPAVYAEILMDAADETATKFWADAFGALHIGFAFVIHFILQLLRFLLFSILRPLTVGIFQLIADYFFKPILTVLFNGVLQPLLILFYNIATSLRDLCEPLAAAIGFFLKEIAAVFRAFRIVEVQKIECCHTHKII